MAQNAKGKQLATVPAAAKKTQAWADLDAVLSFLQAHDAEAGAEVEKWLLGALPIPRVLLGEIWADESWRSWLTDLVLATPDGSLAGFLRAIDPAGLRVIDLDGESVTITSETVLLPHPALLNELDDLREFAIELGINQRFNQLFREVHRHNPNQLGHTELSDWADGHFEELRFATRRATAAGFRVSGGYAICRCHEAGRKITARYWIGADFPDAPTITGDLHWIEQDHPLPVGQVGPLAYSEGVRMASHIYAGRKINPDGNE